MTSLENEKEQDSLAKDNVVLTNYRIMKEYGDSYKISIFLENISSIEVYYKTNLFLIILAVISIISGTIGIATEEEGTVFLGIMGLIIGVVSIIAFFLTRKHVITISPNGGKNLNIEVKQTSAERIEEFVTNIQKAKLKQIQQTNS